MKSFIEHLKQSVILQEGAESHARNYAAARRHSHRLIMDPEYQEKTKIGSYSGKHPVQVTVSPVTAARAGGIPDLSKITGYVGQQKHTADSAGMYYTGGLKNQRLDRMNFSSFTGATPAIIPHERRHAVQVAGASINAALKAANLPGTESSERLDVYRKNPTEENKQEFLNALNVSSNQLPTTKAFSKFVSTVSGIPLTADTHQKINTIMTLPHQTGEHHETPPMYSFEPWEMDSRVQDTIHGIVSMAKPDREEFEAFHGTDHLKHLEQFNKTGDVSHLKNFETHVRNRVINAGMAVDDNSIHARSARQYFDRLQDHISSGQMLQNMSTPPQNPQQWKQDSLKALRDFRKHHEQHLQRLQKETVGAAGLILTHGVNFGGRMLGEYQGNIAPEHQEKFNQYVQQTFKSMNPELNLYKEPDATKVPVGDPSS